MHHSEIENKEIPADELDAISGGVAWHKDELGFLCFQVEPNTMCFMGAFTATSSPASNETRCMNCQNFAYFDDNGTEKFFCKIANPDKVPAFIPQP